MANVLPANANNSKVSWTSSDPTIAKVNSTGELTAKTTGALVYNKSWNNKSTVRRSCLQQFSFHIF
jgi:uncharacterized protein YjdB